MSALVKLKSGFAAASLAMALAGTAAITTSAPAYAQNSDKSIILSIGDVHQLTLNTAVTDVVVADPRVADVEVTSSKKMYIYAKGGGTTDIVATDASGRTIYRGKIVVGGNLSSLDQMFKLAMPDAEIQVTAMNNIVLLTGTVAQPEDAAEAERLAIAFTATKGEGNSTGTNIINRIKMATPLQINLQVRVAEVSRSLSKEINGNFATRDIDGPTGNGFLLPFQGANRDFATITGGYPNVPRTGASPTTSYGIAQLSGTALIGAAGKLFGIDVAAAFDLSERVGLVSTLANPNLTTVSGETAEFLAGGEFPIVTSSNNGTSIEYKSYGVNLTYTPTVLADGRISLRVRTEVSDISSQGAVRIGGLEIPATTNRMTETTVEMGSGQSMMISGLLSNQLTNSLNKMPGLGDVPLLGSLFKSNGWRRNETELMIVITPYLVRPVSDSQIKLPTDGLHSPNDLERILLNKSTVDKGEKNRPMPTVAPAAPNGPEMGSVSDAGPALPMKANTAPAQIAASPGFSFDN